jgi:hypothetical protein
LDGVLSELQSGCATSHSADAAHGAHRNACSAVAFSRNRHTHNVQRSRQMEM